MSVVSKIVQKVGSASVFIFVSDKWSAKKLAHKPHLRERLKITAKNEAKKLSCQYFSISHTTTVGGFAISQYPVGFDLEVVGRVISDRVFKRLTSLTERKLKLSPLQAWVIKESSWKALQGFQQPPTITRIKILTIRKKQKTKGQFFLFKTRVSKMLNKQNYGLIFISNRIIMGISIYRPQL